MKRIAAYLASAALGAALVGSGPAWAQMGGDIAGHRYPYNPDNYAYNYGYPYNYAYGFGYPYNYAYGYPFSYASGYGYPYADSYGYANPFAIVTAPIAALAAPATALTTPVAAAAPFAVATSAAAPLVTGRSVATGQMGMTCSTPIKACELYHASWVGNGCSCRVPGGRARGAVTAPLAAAPPIAAAAATAPLMTGRSVATAGNYCTTPAKTCLLYHSSWVGNGCSCRMPGGRERGSVTPQ